MATISIELNDEQMARLRELARQARQTPEELVRDGLGRWLDGPDESFERAADYVLRKNAELYRRLA